MSNRRKNPPAPGVYCDAITSTGGYPCSDPAVFLVFYAAEKTGKEKRESACGAHLGKLVQMRTPVAEFSREMFRVIPWETVMAESAKKG
ncbi:hypothetical protein ACWD7M_16215 [Streptomyces griseus]